MAIPKADKTPRTTIVQANGSSHEVKYVELTNAEELDCVDEAMVGEDFRPGKFTQSCLRRMVVEIDGETIHPDSRIWLELNREFGRGLAKLVKGERGPFLDASKKST